MTTKLILLGCGTPNACPHASGPAAAVTVGDRCYLFDCGPGVVRQLSKVYHQGENALYLPNISRLFITHLHSDHTAGLADVILTPWVLERTVPLEVYGPAGISSMCTHLLQAYEQDIRFRIEGFEQANKTGIQVHPHEIEEGILYTDDRIQIEAFCVAHGQWPSYAYRCTTRDKIIVISGDTAPLEKMAVWAKDCDILLHEVYYSAGLSARTPKWQKYHASVHTGALELGRIAQQAHVKLLVTYHRLYHMDMLDNTIDLQQKVKEKDACIEKEIRQNYKGQLLMGQDLDILV